MKWFLIIQAIGLVASDKLDRTYLPPPGAQFSGGNLGDRDVPLEPPHHSYSEPFVGHEGSLTNFGINEGPVNFGDKIPKVPFNSYTEKIPTTTTSYAFSQTTTYLPADNYETTLSPINPVTGLPVLQGNYPYGASQNPEYVQNLPNSVQNPGQSTPFYTTNIQPDVDSTSAPTNFGSPSYDQSVNQRLNQYPGQNVATSGSTVQIPESVFSTTGQNQYPGEQYKIEQPGIQAANTQNSDQYPGLNAVSPGGNGRGIPGGNQKLIQYPAGQLTGQQEFTTASSTNLLPVDNQYNGIPGKTINVLNQGEPQLTPVSYQTQGPQNVEGIPSIQFPLGNQNVVLQEPGLTPSTVSPSFYNNVSATAPLLGIQSSNLPNSDMNIVYRPERPQAAADRSAVILNYENVRTPNGYSYSFDTSNGIHADETGIVDDGTKAQGSYSYIGDDGKLYSVTYTADENGFQPRGDHLPTPPPIPEAIKKVIEQAAKDKEAGIFDDGSYNEAKYGDKKFQGPSKYGQPLQSNNQQLKKKGNKIKPIVGLNDYEYDDTETRVQGLSKNTPSGRPYYQINGEIKGENVPEGNRRLSNDDVVSKNLSQNVTPIEKEGLIDNYEVREPESSRNLAMLNKDNLPYSVKDATQENQVGVKSRRPSGRRPISKDAKDMKYQYPESGSDGNGSDDSEENKYYDRDSQDIEIGSPSVSDGSGENIKFEYDGASGVPIKTKATMKPRVKGNRPFITKGTVFNKNGKPQNVVFDKETTDTPSSSDYINNPAKQPVSNEHSTQKDDSGYHYQPPNTKFEQTNFPTRFNTQEIPINSERVQERTEINKSTTRKPFITPYVYSQNDETQQSTTRRPFTTVGVTTPTDSSYTDYDDGDNYDSDQDIEDNAKINSPEYLPEKSVSISRPYQGTTTALRPQHTSGIQKIRVPQKESVTPGGTFTPGHGFSSTTPMPSYNSRFGNAEAPRRMKPHKNSLSTINLDSSTAVRRPISSQIPSRTFDNKNQTTGPNSQYRGTNVIPGYQPVGITTGSGLVFSKPGVSTPQSYSSSTFKPYSSKTTISPTSDYNSNYGSRIPFSTPGVYQSSPSEDFHNGYHYGPPKSGYSSTVGTPSTEFSFFTPSESPTVSPFYQTTYQPSSTGFPSSTSVPTTPAGLSPFIQSQEGNIASEFSPIGSYQGDFQNDPSVPNYSTTIVSSTPGGRPVFGYPESSSFPDSQNANGNEYGILRPAYSTDSPLTVGTAPGSLISSTAPSQGYSTTYRPGFQTTKDSFVPGPVVDGFGRPITVEQGGSHTEFYQGGHRPVDNEGSRFGTTEQQTAYLGPHDQSKIIGEDFSGPKQPQRYDPKTGYHYK